MTFPARDRILASMLGYLKATVEFALEHEGLKEDFKSYLKELEKTL